MIRVTIDNLEPFWSYTIYSGNNPMITSAPYRHRDNARAAVRKLRDAATGDEDPGAPVPSRLSRACQAALIAEAKAYKQGDKKTVRRPVALAIQTEPVTEAIKAAMPAAAPSSAIAAWETPGKSPDPWS